MAIVKKYGPALIKARIVLDKLRQSCVLPPEAGERTEKLQVCPYTEWVEFLAVTLRNARKLLDF